MGFDFSAMLDEDTKRKVGDEETVVDAVYAGSEMSLETVKPKFRDLVTGVDIMVARANGLVVDSDGGLKDATALGVDAKRIAKLIEAKRKEVIGPHSEFVSSVNNFCSGFTERLVLNARKTNPSSIEGVLKAKISTYQAKVELERRKREEEARRVAAELQDKLDAEAAEANRKAEEEARQKAVAEAQAWCRSTGDGIAYPGCSGRSQGQCDRGALCPGAGDSTGVWACQGGERRDSLWSHDLGLHHRRSVSGPARVLRSGPEALKRCGQAGRPRYPGM